MLSIGIRELRDGLSKHIATVREGHSITVTDHGRPVARIVPVDVPTKLEQLIMDGKVTAARGPRRLLPDAIEAAGPVSDLIDRGGDDR